MIDLITLIALGDGDIPINEPVFVVNAVISMRDMRVVYFDFSNLLEIKGLLVDYKKTRLSSSPVLVEPYEMRNDLEHDVIIIRQWQTQSSRMKYGRARD